MKINTIALAAAFALSSSLAFAQAGNTAGGSSAAGGAGRKQDDNRRFDEWRHHRGRRHRDEEWRHRRRGKQLDAIRQGCEHARRQHRRLGGKEGRRHLARRHDEEVRCT